MFVQKQLLEGESISLILKLVADACNIACQYCYEKQNRNDLPSKMSLEIVKRALDVYSGNIVNVELHGGEPLLYGKGRTLELVRFLRSLNNVRRISVQTNGILLDAELIEMFKEYSVAVSVSIDGRSTHNASRVDHHGRSTEFETLRGINLLAESGLSIGLACVVSRTNVDSPREVLRELASIPGVFYVKFIPCFDVTKSNVGVNEIASYAIRPNEFSRFVCDILTYYSESELFESLIVDPIVSIARSVGGKTTGFCVYDDKKCSHVLTLYPNGRLKSCDEFYSDTTFGLVSSNSTGVTLPIVQEGQSRIIEPLYSKHEVECLGCEVREVCRGGCIATRELFYGTDHYLEYCEMQRSIIREVGKAFESAIH